MPARDSLDPEGQFRRVAVDTKIRFCRPQLRILGIELPTIDYRRIQPELIAGLGNLNLIKTGEFGLPLLSRSAALNVWIAPLPDGNAGFAQLPGGPGETDGIVIDPDFFFGTSPEGSFYAGEYAYPISGYVSRTSTDLGPGRLQ